MRKLKLTQNRKLLHLKEYGSNSLYLEKKEQLEPEQIKEIEAIVLKNQIM